MDKTFPGGPPPRVNGISKRDGGYAPPHSSHQMGRDVDIGFYYREGVPGRRVWDRARYMDLERNWGADPFADHHDRRPGDPGRLPNPASALRLRAVRSARIAHWLDSLFHDGANSMLRHARRHRDHFHVRFYNARAQELGRRIQPLGEGPEAKHVVQHRIRRGDNLGRIARKYGTTVSAIRAANGLRTNFLRAGRVLAIPLRGPCTSCPVPPPLSCQRGACPPTARHAPVRRVFRPRNLS